METPAHTTLDPSDLLCSCATNQRHPAVLCPCPWGQSCFASLKGTTQNLADGFDWFILDLLLTTQSTMFLYALPVISLRWFWLYCIHYKNVYTIKMWRTPTQFSWEIMSHHRKLLLLCFLHLMWDYIWWKRAMKEQNWQIFCFDIC